MSETGQVVGLRCQNCGAPLDITPESIVVVCKYCGYPNWTMQAYTYPIVVVPAESGRARRFFEEYLRRDEDMSRIRDRVELRRLETVYVPVYYASVHAEVNYRGRARVLMTKVEVRDKEVRTRTRTVEVVVSGTYRRDLDLVFAARRSIDEAAIGPLLEYYKKTRTGLKHIPIGQVDWSRIKGDVLGAEISPQDAQVYARDEACDTLQAEVEKRMNDEARKAAMVRSPGWVPTTVDWVYKRIPCKSENRALSPITLIPYISAIYAYENKLYRTVFAGWDGRRVYGEEPVLASERILYTAGALVSSSLLGGGGAALAAASMGSTGRMLLGLLLFLAGAAGSYLFSKEALKDVRVEKG